MCPATPPFQNLIACLLLQAIHQLELTKEDIQATRYNWEHLRACVLLPFNRGSRPVECMHAQAVSIEKTARKRPLGIEAKFIPDELEEDTKRPRKAKRPRTSQ
jgi:hypothetical protein